MLKFFTIVSVLVLIAFITYVDVEAGANGQQPLVVSPCTNNCPVACCNCNIEVTPPVCVQCCFEEPPKPAI
ncbi:unnamed protein product [Withania somnifera]